MVTNNEFKRRMILGEIARLGLRVDQHGNGWRVYGTGVDIRVSDLAMLHTKDLRPSGLGYEYYE